MQLTQNKMLAVVENERRSLQTNSTRVSCLPPAPDLERQEAILRIVGEVEIAKMINPALSPQQRTALMLLLSNTGLSVEEIARMGKGVMTRTTYGNIAFEHWMAEYADDPLPRMKICPKCKKGFDWRSSPSTLCPQCHPLRPNGYEYEAADGNTYRINDDGRWVLSHCTRCGCNHSADEDCEQMKRAQ